MRSVLVQGAMLALLYSLLLGGLVFFWQDELKTAVKIVRSRRRLSLLNRITEPQGPLECHLYHTMAVAFKAPLAPKTFLLLSGWLTVIVLVLSWGTLSFGLALLVSLLAGLLPYGLLRLRAEVMRRKGSFEGEQLVSEFLRQYRIHRFNVYETMETLVGETQVCGPVSRRLLFQVLTRLRNTGSETGIKGAVAILSAGIGTNWSRMLAQNIRLAAERGVDVSLALEDILIQLRQAREIHEERNRLNSEAARMTLFMVPLLYLVTLFLAASYMDISPLRVYENQLKTAEGLSCFLLIWFLFACNLAITELISHQKMDF